MYLLNFTQTLQIIMPVSLRPSTVLLGLLISLNSYSQTAAFDIALEPVKIEGLAGLQSYAFGQHNGKWLIIGGRLDGLHRRQPFAAFDEDGHNRRLFVIDPVRKKQWTASISSLSTDLQEQLSATNMQFFQQDKYLYLAGGYGFSARLDDHTTYAKLTAVDVPATINAVINKGKLATHFRQITDSQFQVTGGRIVKINELFYMVGGQKFLGAYNPMGPDHGPGFIQEYTNQIRKFSLSDDGNSININHLPPITDEENLHRRDYNVVPQIMPGGQEGATAFSGVFKKAVNIPFLNVVDIDAKGYAVNPDFTQYYNHYHCASFPVYDAATREMNTVFLGGIAMYYDDNGLLTLNSDVPFVKTIARVSRNAEGKMAEYKLPIQMPALLGAGAELIPNELLPRYANGVIKYDELGEDSVLVGYIYGGIVSKQPNTFWVSEGELSKAASKIFKVLLVKNGRAGAHRLNEQSTGTLQMEAYPDIKNDSLVVRYKLAKATDVKLTLSTPLGKKVAEMVLNDQPAGDMRFSTYIKKLSDGGIFMLTIETAFEKATQKIIVEP
jgi:hypothetical protein